MIQTTCRSAIAAMAASLIWLTLSAAQTPPAGTAPQSTSAQLDAYIKLARSNVQTQKAQLIGEALQLSATEAAAFWPVYKQYEAELATIGDERLAIIKDYAAHYEKVDDAKATELTDRALANEEKRLGLLKKYVGELRKVVRPVKVGRFVQVENAINKVVDLQVASQIPLLR